MTAEVVPFPPRASAAAILAPDCDDAPALFSFQPGSFVLGIERGMLIVRTLEIRDKYSGKVIGEMTQRDRLRQARSRAAI
jgi:hypothetical protein